MAREREREEENRPVGHNNVRGDGGGEQVGYKYDIPSSGVRTERTAFSHSGLQRSRSRPSSVSSAPPLAPPPVRCGCGLADVPPHLCPCWPSDNHLRLLAFASWASHLRDHAWDVWSRDPLTLSNRLVAYKGSRRVYSHSRVDMAYKTPLPSPTYLPPQFPSCLQRPIPCRTVFGRWRPIISTTSALR